MDDTDALAWVREGEGSKAKRTLYTRKKQLETELISVNEGLSSLIQLEKTWKKLQGSFQTVQKVGKSLPAGSQTSVCQDVLNAFDMVVEGGTTGGTESNLISVQTVKNFAEMYRKTTTISFKLYEESWAKYNKSSERLTKDNGQNASRREELQSLNEFNAQSLMHETKGLDAKLDRLIRSVPIVKEISSLCTAQFLTDKTDTVAPSVSKLSEINTLA